MVRGPESEFRSPEERITALEHELKEIKGRLWCEQCEVPYGAVLSDRDLKRLIENGRVGINPLPNLEIGKDSDLGTCKVDLHLGSEAMYIDPTKVASLDLSESIPEDYYEKVNLRKQRVIIPTNRVIIATTQERLKLPDDMIGILVGKSGNARRGLKVEGAPIFDAGFDTFPMLELQNTSGLPLTARYGESICAMVFQHLSSPTLQGYAQRQGVKYSNQDGARI
ncbi:dCTP deaminase [Candidatus Microgenomates bacterium]|nr:dCTP deaminase [Candidatus Microgenomates bacterium]